MVNFPSEPNNNQGPGSFRGVLRLLVVPAAILACMVVLGRVAGEFWPRIEASVASLEYMGYLLFAAAVVLLATTCFPVSVLAVSAGALFGPWAGMALVFPSLLATGSLMFWMGRGFLRRRIQKMIAHRPRLVAVDRMAQDRAFKLNILTRLSPLNFGLASYTLAAGPTTFRAFFWGLFAILPSSLAQVWFGSLAGEAAGSSGDEGFATGRMILLVVGVIFFLVLTWVVARMIKQAWADAPADGPNDGSGRKGGVK